MKDKKVIKMPPEGSLGVLALGDIGVKLWREARQKAKQDQNEKEEDGKEADK